MDFACAFVRFQRPNNFQFILAVPAQISRRFPQFLHVVQEQHQYYKYRFTVYNFCSVSKAVFASSTPFPLKGCIFQDNVACVRLRPIGKCPNRARPLHDREPAPWVELLEAVEVVQMASRSPQAVPSMGGRSKRGKFPQNCAQLRIMCIIRSSKRRYSTHCALVRRKNTRPQ
jgi:hypothetical protein